MQSKKQITIALTTKKKMEHRIALSKALFSSHFWSGKGLARTLGIGYGEIISASRDKGVTVRAVPTIESCLPNEAVSCGVLAALADEWTTQCLVLQDNRCRPGVTVSLTLSFRRAFVIKPKRPLIFRMNSIKTGKTLGFCDFSISDEASGIMIASGHHIKYLPMGTWFDLLTSKPLLPFVTYLATKTSLQPLSEVHNPQPIPTIKQLFDPGAAHRRFTRRDFA